MKTHAILTCLAILALGHGLSAQDAKWVIGIKSGGGAALNSSSDQSRVNLNLGLTGEYRLTEKTAVFAELKYRTFRSVYHEATRFGSGYTLNGTFVNQTASTLGITMANSVDVRRDVVEGYGLAFGYRGPLMGDFSWQAGLSLDSFKSTQEVTGAITVNTGVPASTTREGLSYTPSKTGVKPGAFVGAQWTVSPNFYVESNLAFVSFKQINYLPTAYTGAAASTETKNVNKVLLEVNAGFRF